MFNFYKMVMDASQKAKVEEYINNNEQGRGYGKLADTVADLAGVEKETKENFLTKRLKNDEALLTYAGLAMSTEKLNIGESIKKKLLEVKLSITCPYFSDFKIFLEELKRGPDTSNNTSTAPTSSTTSTEMSSSSPETSTHKFCGVNIDDIKSEPFQKNSTTGVTWCSKTARSNGNNFGLDLPSGNAYDAGMLPGKDSIETIPKDKINERPNKWWEGIKISLFKSISKGNYADIYVGSSSNYGHRASAFKDDSGQRYVLDPYIRVNGKLDNSPKKLEDYLAVKKIVKAHIYQSKGYKKVK